MDSFSATRSQLPQGSERCLLAMAGAMTIESAEQIKEALQEALDSSSTLTLDMTAVTAIDIIGLQFICALHRSARAQGKALALIFGPSGAVSAVLGAAGFRQHGRCFDDPEHPCLWNDPDSAT